MLHAPPRVLAVVMGVPAGLGAGLGARLAQDGSWASALVSGVVVGLFSGAVLSVIVHRKNRRMREAVGELSETQLEHAIRAGWRGPVPEDAATREAAHRLLVSQLGELRRQRVWMLPLLLLVLGAGVFIAVDSGSGWWVVGLVGVLLFATSVCIPRHLQRRAELLGTAPPG